MRARPGPNVNKTLHLTMILRMLMLVFLLLSSGAEEAPRWASGTMILPNGKSLTRLLGMETIVGRPLTERTFLQRSAEAQLPSTRHRSLLVAESTRRLQRHPAHGPDLRISPSLGPGQPLRFIKDVSPGQMTRIIRINTTIPSRKWCNQHVQAHSLLPLVVRHIR